jgi:hypothetical protein
MWPFSKNEPSKPKDIPATWRERLGDVESDLKRIRVEWEDTLDRFERIMGRLNKRAQRETAQEEAPATPAPPARAPVPDEVAIRRRMRPGGIEI